MKPRYWMQLGFLAALLAVALLALPGNPADAQTSITVTVSIGGDAPPTGFTYPTIREGGGRTLRFTLSSPAPAGGVSIGNPGTPTSGWISVESVTISAGDTSIGFPLGRNQNTHDTPNYLFTHVYPNNNGLTVMPADRTTRLTVIDDDPTVVTLARVGSGEVSEGDTAQFTVSLSRALVDAGTHGPTETIVVPLDIGGGASTAGAADWSIALDADATNTGATLTQPTATEGPKVTFSGAGAQTAVLNLAILRDDVLENENELLRVALASDTTFDAESGTNVGGGADPKTSGTPAEPQNFLLAILSEGAITVPADWPLLPDGLNEGDEFRLIFMTSQKRDATSTDIADYDTFAQNAAGGSSAHAAIKHYASRFKVVGSTRGVDARDHTGTDPNNDAHMNVPIYWLNGKRVAADNSRFWSSTWENWAMADRRNEAGNRGNGDLHWSGTDADGTASSTGSALGENTPAQGQFRFSEGTVGPMGSGTTVPKAQHHSFYVISPVFKKAITPPTAAAGTGVPGVEFRVCPSGSTCVEGSDAGWVAHDSDDGPPTIELNEGGASVSYQFRLRLPPTTPTFRSVNVKVSHPGDGTMSATHNAIRPGDPDRDRLICHGGSRPIGLTSYTASPNTFGGGGHTIHLPRLGVDSGGNAVYSDQTGGCPHSMKQIPYADRATWQTVTVSAGEDPDAFDHVTSLVHYTVATNAPPTLFQKTPHVRANSDDHDDRADEWPIRIRIIDDDEWEQDFEVSSDGGATWTSLFDGGFNNALPGSMGAGESHSFRVRLKNNPATLANRPDAFQILSFDSLNTNARVSSSVDDWPSRGKVVDWPADTSNGAWNGHVTFTVHVADGATGSVSIKLRAQNLLRRVDNELPVAGATHRTRSYTHNLTSTACVGICPASIISHSPSDWLTWGRLNKRSTLVASQQDPVTTPELSVTAGSGVTEGGDATFTITANPAPVADLDVTVTVSQSGDYGATTGQRTVTIPTTGSFTLTVSTINDDADETDGSVTATLDAPAADAGYTVSATQGAATVGVADDDASSGYTVDPQVVANVKLWAAETHNGAEHVNRWQRVLVAFGELDASGVSGVAMTAAEAQTYADLGWPRWVPVVAELTALEASPQDPLTTPEVSVTAGGGITEGGDATFTVTASPAPAADLDVTVTVSQSGDYGATTGKQTVTIPTTGSVTLTVGTTNDDADETDGSVTATLDATAADGGYTVSATQGAATVSVADDDAAAGYTVDPQVVANVKLWAAETHNGAEHVNRWQRVLVAFGELDANGVSGIAMTASEAQTYADLGWQRWVPVVAELTALEASQNGQLTPEVSISAGGGITEGGDATFTLTASPAPAANLDVSVTVSQSGNYGATTGQRTVTIPTTGSVTLTVGTTDDQTDEPNGSVTATVNTGSGYTVSSTQAAGTVTVADDDDPPVVVVPVVTISGGNGVTEGGSATFTLTATPAPAANLSVSVNVGASGDFGATIGAKSVTVPTSGSATFTVGTTNDQVDEPNGSVTATLVDGADYDLGTSKTATVAVADNDDPPVVVVPVVTISGGNGVTEGGDATFTVSASPAPSANLSVTVTVSASGDFGATAGTKTITIPTSGSATLTVGTTDDSADEADEADGSVTATLVDGADYDLGTSKTATVSVSDNDVPELSISAGGGITEGGSASFTITASPAPASPITVKIAVSESGDFGASGAATITVSGASTTYTVSTTNDQLDEADGSVTATLEDGTGYTVSSSSGAATVAVADNDDPPVEPDTELSVAIDDASGTEGSYLEFTVRLSRVSTEEVVVNWNTATAPYDRTRTEGRARSSDYSGVQDQFVFNPGVTELTGQVWLESDGEVEGDEYFAVELFLGEGWKFKPDATGTMTIRDAD